MTKPGKENEMKSMKTMKTMTEEALAAGLTVEYRGHGKVQVSGTVAALAKIEAGHNADTYFHPARAEWSFTFYWNDREWRVEWLHIQPPPGFAPENELQRLYVETAAQDVAHNIVFDVERGTPEFLAFHGGRDSHRDSHRW